MNKHLPVLIVLLGFGLVGCDIEDNKSRLICDCVYSINNGNKSSCETSEFIPVTNNFSLVLDEANKTFVFDGSSYTDYDNSFEICLEDLDEGLINPEECKTSILYDYGRMVEFSDDSIQHFYILDILGSVFTELDRTNLVLKKQIRPASDIRKDDGSLREPVAISNSYPYYYYQCRATKGI